ncbi:MAG: hypothetical protein AB7K86_26715 [Rhodospirillales bacterium]
MTALRTAAAAALAIAMLAAPAAAGALWQPPPGDSVAALSGDGLAYGSVRFRTVLDDPDAKDPGYLQDKRLVITRGGVPIFRSDVSALWSVVAVRDDILPGGRPLAVLASYSGGAHCCAGLQLVTLDGVAAVAADLALGHGDLPDADDLFVDADGDGQADIRAFDQTFAYWIVSFAESPFTPILLHWRDGAFRLNLTAMRRPPPTDASLAAAAAAIRAEDRWREGGPPPLLWERMSAQIFSGNAPAAWQLLERAWPPAVPGRDRFAADFRNQLKTSPWWDDLLRLNPAGLPQP